MSVKNQTADVSPTGVPGLDLILLGGLPKHRMYLLQGKPGTGKTTLAVQFLMEGIKRGESSLYVTFSETKAELEAVAKSHGWDLTKVSILDLSVINEAVSVSSENTLFHSSEVELGKTRQLLQSEIERLRPDRVVIDSLSELRLLADTSFKYRRQMLSLKEFFQSQRSTVLLLDDLTTEAGDLHVQSIVHGVLLLEKFRAGYGVERREFHIAKLRGVGFKGGTHDYSILRGGIEVYPRLVATEHEALDFKLEELSSGNEKLDKLIGGGLTRGTSNLILGPAGSGKSTLTARFATAAAARGQKVVLYSFEESLSNFMFRAKSLAMDLQPYMDKGLITLRKIDPAEMTPGQFAALVTSAADLGAEMVIIDSLNGYIHAMPESQHLILQLHELAAYLGGRGIVTILVLSQSGVMGSMRSPLDLTYLADTVILTRFFEAFGRVKRAISVIKKRTSAHEESLREYKMGPGGIELGPILSQFEGIFTGTPRYTGDAKDMFEANE
jgi:circadian clock protein KaiC